MKAEKILKRTTAFAVLLTVLIVLLTVFIFANSIQPSEGSLERSEQVSEQIQQIVNVDRESYERDIYKVSPIGQAQRAILSSILPVPAAE